VEKYKAIRISWQPEENKEHFDFLVSLVTNDASLTRGLNPALSWQKHRSIIGLLLPAKLDLHLKMKVVK
jgi:hypothetical protein